MSLVKALLLSFLLILLIIFFNKTNEYYTYSWSLNIIQIILTYLGVILIALKLDLKEFKSFLKSKDKLKLNSLFYGLIGILGLLFINDSILLFQNKDFIHTEQLNRENNFEFVIVSLILLPLLEELFFRKLLAGQLYKRYGLNKAIIYSSLLFSITHLPNEVGLLYPFLGGMIFGFFYLKIRNYIFVAILHSLYNLFNFLIFSLNLYSNKISTLTLFTFCTVGIVLVYFSASHFKKKIIE